MTNAITTLSVREIGRALDARALSSREVTEAYLAAIDARDAAIHAYVTRLDDHARRRAEDADRARADDGNVPPLCGVPHAAKDNIAVGGYPMTCASRMLADFVPPYTATVVERAGGLTLGKTNMDEFAMGSSCEKSIFGPSYNPLDPIRTTGGSSGGSAAAVAACLAPWAIGTDTGGSCRQPAAFCGVVSMKPTYGLVSRSGVVEFASSMDTVCPITRDVADNAVVLDAIAGRDARDMTSLDPMSSCTACLEDGVRGLRIGVMRDIAAFCSPGQTAATLRAARQLEALGASVEEITLPDPTAIVNAYFVTAAAECSSNLARYDGMRYGYAADGATVQEIMARTRERGFGEEVRRRILAGTYILSSTISGDRFRRVQALRQALCAETDALLARYDAILLPTTADCAFSRSDYENDPMALYNSDCFTALANLTGHPAITLPCGGDGVLPYGAMLMGARLTEARLYGIAYALEQETASFVRKEVRTLDTEAYR